MNEQLAKQRQEIEILVARYYKQNERISKALYNPFQPILAAMGGFSKKELEELIQFNCNRIAIWETWLEENPK